MESDLYTFGSSLKTFLQKNQPSEAESLISQINRTFTQSELSAFTIDTCMLNIFDESTGLLNFIKNILHKPEYKKVKLKCFELLYTLVNNFAIKVQKHLINIMKACAPVVRSSASAIEKQKALELITLIIQKGNFYGDTENDVDTELADLYNNTLFKCLHVRFDKSNTVQEELLVAVGCVAKKFPAVLTDPAELLRVIISQLNRELHKSDKSYPVITGCVTALSNYLESFPFNPTEDKSTADTIYKCVKMLADPEDATRRVAFRESLSLITKHITLLRFALYSEAKWWHVTLLKWFSLGAEDRKVAYNILEVFYQETANILSTQNEDSDREVFKYFFNYFVEMIMKASSEEHSSTENYQIHLAIRGFGLFARAFKLHVTAQEINKAFVTISHILEHTYILNKEPNNDEIMYLPDYVQTLSFITSNLPQLHEIHINCLQEISILMIKIFPKMQSVQYHLVVDAFVMSSYQLLKCKGNALENFMQDVIYQGVIWTCSHTTALDAELYKDEIQPMVTYKNYLPLWNGLLNMVNVSKYENYEITVKARKSITKKIVDELIKTLFLLINKLNLNTKLKDSSQPITDPGSAYEALQTNDFVIFVNVVDFYQDILEKVEPSLFKNWINMYIDQVIVKSMKCPLVSGFYKLLAACLRKCDKLNYFEESKLASKEDLRVCYQTVQTFLKEILWKMKQFKDDLQIACLNVILAAPVCIIKDLLPYAASAFITLFSVGRSYLQLADLGIDALEKWLKHLPLTDTEPFLKVVLPSLDSYLKSRSLGGSLTTDAAVKIRKTKQTINKRRILVQTEPELFKLQIKILSFIGQLNSNLCLSFVHFGENVEPVVWSKTPYLKVTLPYSNSKLNVYLDKFVPRIVELALYSSDRKIRLAACELLHAIVMIILGTSHPLEASKLKLKELDPLIETVAKPIIKLGCDTDEVVQQLYSPLALQLMHYYSHPRQMYNSHTQIIIETLNEAVVNPSDSAIRDFSGNCIKEFVTWTIKQADQDDLRKNPINIKLWVRTIQAFSVHPDSFKRLGAALIFNNIYTILREETYMFNMFWLEILYSFVVSLALIQVHNSDDKNCVEQVFQALNHVQRGFVEKCGTFNKIDKERRKPPGFEGNMLKDVALWLLKETGSSSPFCRQKCMSMFCKIAPLVVNCNNNLQKFNELYIKNDPEWVVLTYERELIKTPTLKDVHSSEGTNGLFTWMQGLLCALDGYIFVATNSLIPAGVTSKKSQLFNSLQFFLEHVQLYTIQEALNSIPGNENIIFASTEKDYFNSLKSTVVTKIIELIVIFSENELHLSYITKTPTLFWNNYLWDLVRHCIFDAQTLGYVVAYTENSDLERNKLLDMLNKINNFKSDTINSLINSLSSYMINKFVTHTELGPTVVSLKQRDLLKGMLLLQKSQLAGKLNIKEYFSGTIKNLKDGLTEDKNGQVTLKKLHKSAQNFCDLKLQLALEDENELYDLITFLCSQKTVKTENQNQDILYGLYMFETFKKTVMKYIIKNFVIFFNTVSKLGIIKHALVYVFEILRYIHRNQKNVEQNIIQTIVKTVVENWENISGCFNDDVNKKLQGMQLISQLINITTEPLHNIVLRNPAIELWVINLLNFEEMQWTDEDSLSFNCEILNILPRIIGPFDTHGTELRDGLEKLKTRFLNQQSNLKIALITTFKKLLIAVKISKSKILLSCATNIYITVPYSTKDIAVKDNLKPFIRYASPEIQINSINLVYERCFNTAELTNPQRYLLANDILSALIQNCHYNIFEQFHVAVINSILSILDKKNESQEFNMDYTVNKTIAYVMVELLFGRIKIENFENNLCIISKSAYPNQLPSEKMLVKALTRNALQACKEKYSFCSQEERDVFRLYQCRCYKALVSIISNTQKEIDHYNWLFIREDKKQDILWHSLVDVNKKYTFEVDFDKVPSMRKVLVNIRSDILSVKKGSDANIRTVKYMESQHLFKSTLSEDVTRYDFSHSALRSQSDQSKSISENVRAEEEFQIVLEAIDVNEHECMAVVCGLIQHLVESDISPLPLEADNIFLPKWMKGIRNVMLAESTHNNVKIFLAKVIHNTRHIFKSYAKWFFAPIIKTIVDGCLGNSMNFFVTDLVIMMTKWSTLAIPTEDKVLASKLLEFLMNNADSDRRDIFKYNLEQIKLVVEAWKSVLEVPYNLIYTKLQLPETSKKLDVGIHLAAILLANGIAPWQPNEVKGFLMTLCKVMRSEHRSVYQPCAEVLGMSLQYMSSDQDSTQHLEKFKDYLHKCLSKISNDNKFAYCLQGIALKYPDVADQYLCRLVSKLNHVQGNFKSIYLKIFLARIEVLHSFNELSSIDLRSLLMEENLEIQVLALEVIEKSVSYLNISNLASILNDVSKLVTSSFTICRSMMYDIFIMTYNSYSSQQNEQSQEIIGICKDILLQGLIEKDSVIQEKILIFWCSASNLPLETTDMFLYLLNSMYKTSIEEHYVCYSTYLLLNVLKSTDEFSEKLFDYALHDCDFQDYNLISNWRRQHVSMAPLFADTLRSQDFSMNPMNPNVLRATVSTLEFQPTQMGPTTSTQSYKQFVTPTSSLLFGADVDDEVKRGVFKDPNYVLPQTDNIRSRRFLRDRSKISRHFAYLEVKKSLKAEELRKDRIKQSERDVTVYRKYRIGDYPDIEITLASVITPLQILVRCDAVLARCLYTSIFQSLANKIEDNKFIQSVNSAISNIFTNSTNFVPSTIGTFLDIALTYKKTMKFDATVISSVCHASGLLSVGSLLLEDYIMYHDDDVVPAKRRKGVESGNVIYWVKLAELYKGMEEWDMVSAVFMEKMNCSETVLSAIEAESSGHWRSAQEFYARTIEEDISQERKDFYYESYFKCFAALAEWDKLSKVIEETVVTDDQANTWACLWDDDWNQQKLLPWYIKAELRSTLNRIDEKLFVSINEYLVDPQKSEYLKANFGEELAMLCLLQNDGGTANYYLNHTITDFLENWSHLNPLLVKLRSNKVLNLRNIIDIYLFVNLLNNITVNNENSVFNNLLKSWKETFYDPLEPLLLSETRTVYRNQFISVLTGKLQSILDADDLQARNKSLNEVKFKLHIDLVENAIRQGNYYVARKYIKLSTKPNPNSSIENMQWNLALSKILFLRAQMLDENEDKVSLIMDSWSRIGNPGISSAEDDILCYFIHTKEHVYNLTQEMYKVMLSSEPLFNDRREDLLKLVGDFPLNDKDDVWTYGVKHLENSLDVCENEIGNMMMNDNLKVYSCMADAYVKLAHCVQKKAEFDESFILYVLRSMKLGSVEGKQLFPCLLNKDIGVSYKDTFLRESSQIPTWMYLGWLPQLLANLDSPCIFSISDILLEVAKIYPQAVMYPYRLSREMYKLKEDDVGALGKEIIENLDEILLNNSVNDKFLKAMACVSSPSNVLRYHIIKLLRASTSKEQFVVAYQNLFDEVYPEEVPDYKNAKSTQGVMFKKIEKFAAKIKNIFKGKFNSDTYRNTLLSLEAEVKELKYERSTKLVDYSPWLANFQATELHANMEIPGQYTGDKRPLVQYHVKLMGLSPTVLLLKSLRAPIRITILGNDGKEYHYLVKFGEDLRQDQRIEQLFNLMNKILLHDPHCNKRLLSICTYQVVPLSSRLGIIEWINKTKELKDFIDDGISQTVDQQNYRKSTEEYLTWIEKATPRTKKNKATDIEIYGTACKQYSRDSTICKYKTFVHSLPLDVLRKSFWNISVNSESFFALRHTFAVSYAVMCISHWILGIGDRHLSNTLISLCNGQAIGIDFGHAFGTATQILGVPELVPFRLTPHILYLLEPLQEHGLIQETMIHTLRAFRKSRDILLATMNVFIKEPSLDWLDFAKRSNLVAQEWYPNKKIEHAERKLQGANPTTIMIEELRAGRSLSKQYLEAYINVVAGKPDIDFRARKRDDLSEENQVKCLIDQATDYNLLGRMYVGWQAWV